MAPPLTGKSLIPHPQQKKRSQSGAANHGRSRRVESAATLR
jgi:hypothetical protein